MRIKKRAIYACGMLTLLLVLIGGSAAPADAKSAPPSLPDHLQIELDQYALDGQTPTPILTLTNPQLIQRLYQLVYSLSPMPQNIACTMELGPHYKLTFRQKNKLLATALAKREGCHPVTIGGETQDRQASAAFWSALDQAIRVATAPTRSQ